MKHEIELTCTQIAFIIEAVKARIAMYEDESADDGKEVIEEVRQILEKLK